MLENIDTSGFHFYCPNHRTYLTFDPHSEAENDRLDAPDWKNTKQGILKILQQE